MSLQYYIQYTLYILHIDEAQRCNAAYYQINPFLRVIKLMANFVTNSAT